MTAHIQIARGEREHNGRTGPKAAFDFYMSQGIPTAREAQAEIRSAGSKKAQFNAYCARFGDQFGTVNGNGAVHSQNQRESVIEKLARLLSPETEEVVDEEVGVEAFEQDEPEYDPALVRVAELLNVDVEALVALANTGETVETPAPQTKREIPAATRISWPMAMALKKVATRTGQSFEIVSKSGKGHTANYGIKLAGRKLTPSRASELIGEFKASR